MKPVDIQIMGHDYRVNCPDNDEALILEAARLVDHAMTTILQAGKVRSRDRIAVLASINLAFELAQLRAEVPHLRQTIQNQVQAIQSDTDRSTLCNDLIARLDQALGEDGHLL
jgi:cell division protein ZapA